MIRLLLVLQDLQRLAALGKLTDDVAVCIAAVIVIALLVFSLQKRREAKERQRQADEKMWSTPLESFGADEAAERAKKYENTDTHTQ